MQIKIDIKIKPNTLTLDPINTLPVALQIQLRDYNKFMQII